MVKVSVIVPVYNVEPYLRKCLESLIQQTLAEIEIIIVNDGSTDGSQQIIDEYARKSDRIKSYVKTNGGLSDARNYGLPYASGEYIGYVDSDDFVDHEMYEVMYQKAKDDDSDIVECNLHHTYPDTENIEIGKEIDDPKEMLMDGRSVVWNKLYKREWLLGTGIIFPKGLIYEDVEFFVKLVPHIRKYSYVKPAFVHYVQRSDSVNHISSAKTLDILKILDNILLYYRKEGYFPEYESALEYFFARILLCSSFYRMCRIANRKERNRVLSTNWEFLNESFPYWRKNHYLKKSRSTNALFMRSINTLTYSCYKIIMPLMIKIRA